MEGAQALMKRVMARTLSDLGLGEHQAVIVAHIDTDDPHVQESLRFLMTRDIAHFQMFAAALETIKAGFSRYHRRMTGSTSGHSAALPNWPCTPPVRSAAGPVAANARSSFPVVKFQTRAVPSSPAVTAVRPGLRTAFSRAM